VLDDGKVFIQFVQPPGEPPEQDYVRRIATDITSSRMGTVTFEHQTASGDAKVGTGLIEWAGVALAAGYLLRDLLRLAVEWAQRARNPIRVRIGKDEITVSDATYQQQESLIEAFAAKHSKR
jgi:hypothetical protein